jgi:hypothetical protein
MRRAPEPTANLVSEGAQRTQVAARLIRRSTSVGFQPWGDGSQTYALRSAMFVSYVDNSFDSSKLTLGAGYNLSRVRSNVHTRDCLVMASQFILKLEPAALSRIQVNIVLARNSQRLAIGGKRVVRNWVVEEVVDFGSGHCSMWEQ